MQTPYTRLEIEEKEQVKLLSESLQSRGICRFSHHEVHSNLFGNLVYTAAASNGKAMFAITKLRTDLKINC